GHTRSKRDWSSDVCSSDLHVGSIISREQLEVIDGYVKSARKDGATILAGGQEANVNGFEGGYWYEPTIITDVTPDMKAVQEEIFGPVVVIEQFSDEKEVIERANDTKYGLAAAIWTKSQGRATRVAHQL